VILVLDFNIVFSALVSNGAVLEVFIKNDKKKEFQFIAPDFIFEEFTAHKEKLLVSTRFTRSEFEEFFNLIKSQIELIDSSEFIDLLPKAIELNCKDAPYIALALKKNCPIFSGDKELAQISLIKVWPPRILLDKLSLI